MQYDNLSLDIIGQANILQKSDFDELFEMKDELKDTFLKVQVHRTRTEMEVSVLNEVKHPTSSSKYWQSVQEQNVHFTELVMLSYEYRKNLIEIKKLEREMEKEEDELEKELLKIEIEKKKFISLNNERVAKARIYEIKNWSEIKKREAKKMTEKDLESVNNHQLKSYTERWIKQKKIMGNSGSPAERQNLDGQLVSGLKACKEVGLLDEIIKSFPDDKDNIKLLTQ